MMTSIKSVLLAVLFPVCVVLVIYAVIASPVEFWARAWGWIKVGGARVGSPCVAEGSVGGKLLSWFKAKKEAGSCVQSAPKS